MNEISIRVVGIPAPQGSKTLTRWGAMIEASKKVKPKSDEILEKKTGKPKKSHWRRGHWHTILQGPKRQQRKMKWFQPVYVIGNAT